MKVLCGIPDPAAGGLYETGANQLVRLVQQRAPLPGHRPGFGGATAGGVATLARVVETPSCFRLNDTLARNLWLLRTLELASDLEVGTVVRPHLTQVGREMVEILRGRNEGERLLPLEVWELEIVGPN